MSQSKISTAKLIASLMGAASAVALMAAPAIAQQAADDSRLDVVIITATQREENLQDVPVSAASVPQETLDAIFSSGSDILALATRVPGVYGESSNGRAAPRFYIRGLGNIDFDLGASQPVSIIMDDIVMENVALKSTPVFDVERVEVYRGPQGTLFGRNTTGGIIRFTSVKPTEEFDARAQTSYGSYGTFTFDGAFGGEILPNLYGRASLLVQHRDNWIDDTNEPGEENLGEFAEIAGRVQLLYKPTEDLDVLLNLHRRDLEGTSALFRANVITQGTNGLNSNYDRDRVSYSGGNNDNRQEYSGWGASANVTYDLGAMILTSITGYETVEGSSRGDIDGGRAGIGPGFIPFDADSADSIDDLNQVTQEVRLASDTATPLTWQVGAYYFDSDVTISSITAAFPAPPSATVEHSNTAWAIYGQGTYAFNDALSVTAGVRYTDDDKDLVSFNNAAFNRSVSDSQVSWDLAAMYELAPDFSVYGRIASGFRGPSIQARDVAFGGAPSVAQSETNLSYEVGWKSILLDNTLRFNGSVYTYTVEDIQLTAVGGGGNFVQLINADKGSAWGFEAEAEWAPIDNLVFTGGFAYTNTELKQDDLGVSPCGSGQCTVLDPIVGGFAQINGNPFPNAPEITADFTARYSIPFGADGELFAFTDWSYQGETNIFLYETVEYITDDQFEGGLKFGWARTDGTLEVAAFARNITDEDNIKGGIDFNNNTAFVNEPRIIGVSLKINN